MYSILTINNKIPPCCKTDLLTGQQFIDLLPAIELLTDGLIFIGSLSHLTLTSQCQNLGLDGRGYLIKTSNGYIGVEKVIFFKMKVYSKTVIDWLLGQQQFCLTLERICCPKPAASGNRSVLGSNKTAVILEPSQ